MISFQVSHPVSVRESQSANIETFKHQNFKISSHLPKDDTNISLCYPLLRGGTFLSPDTWLEGIPGKGQKFSDPLPVFQKFSDPLPVFRKISDPLYFPEKFSDPLYFSEKFSDPLIHFSYPLNKVRNFSHPLNRVSKFSYPLNRVSKFSYPLNRVRKFHTPYIFYGILTNDN